MTVAKSELLRFRHFIAKVQPEATKRFLDSPSTDLNPSRRRARYGAITRFLAWCERAGFRHLEDIEPITVAAYIE